MPYTLGLGLVGLGVNSWLQLGDLYSARVAVARGLDAAAPAPSRSFTRRRRHHHVQRSLEWLRWPDGVAVPVNASYYHDALVDHFSSSIASPSRRWSQRFYIDDRFWCGRGCPIFLYIGGEGPQGPPSPQLFMWSLAQKHGALMLALEHRFYGESRPTVDLSVASLRLLTSPQALADLVRFRYFVASSPSAPATGPHAFPQPEPGRQHPASSPPLLLKASVRYSAWVAFGGSYPGALAAWLKIKYPAAITGAVASSAPVYPEFDFEQYAQVVGAALAEPALGGSAKCAGAVRSAAAALAISVAAGALSLDKCLLPAPLCPCTRPADRRDMATYYASLMGYFQDAVQYNLQGRRPYVSDICTAVVAAPLAYAGGEGTAATHGQGREGGSLPTWPLEQLAPLAAATALFSPNASAPECVPSSFIQDEIAPLTNSSFDDAGCDLDCASDRQWIWQSCNEFGFFQTASSPAADNPFSAWGAVLDVETAGRDVCASAFDLPGYVGPAAGPGGRLTALNEYGGRRILESNLTIITGGKDPWKALGVVSSTDPFFEAGGGTQVLAEGVAVAQVAAGAHCRDMYAPAAFEDLSKPVQDTASVRETHALIADNVARYVGYARIIGGTGVAMA